MDDTKNLGLQFGAAGLTRRDLLGNALKTGLALSAAGALAGRSALASAAEGPLGKSWDVLNSYFTFNNIYYIHYDAGTRAAMKAFNAKYHRAVSNLDESKQRSDLENAPSLGIEGVTIIAPSEAIEPALMRILNQAKIYVCNMWTEAPWSTPLDIGDYYTTFGVVNAPKTFEALATQLFKKLGGKGKVIQIDGIRGVSVNSERLAGVEAALKKFPNIDIVTTQAGGWSRDKTRPVIETLLTQYPDVNGIIAHNDDEAVAVVAALRARGLSKKVFVTGNDGVPEALDLVARGELLATLPTHAPWLGGQFIARLFDAMNGWKPTPAERMMHWGCFVLNTPEAATAYKKVMYSGPAPYDWRKMSRVLHPNDWDPQNLIVPFDPATYWAYRAKEKPKGYELPAGYRGAAWAKDKAATAALYKKHFKSDPLIAVRKLCNNGAGQVIA